jgi:hypothetical protein
MQGAFGTRALNKRPRRYDLKLPPTAPARASTSTAALSSVFGNDELGELATALFQSALSDGTRSNYDSNLGSFYAYCDESLIDPLGVTPIDIARYLAWLGKRGTIAAVSLQPYLSAINRLLQDHARPPVALGPLVSGVRKGLANCQLDTAPQVKRLPLPAPVMLSILELAERLLPIVRWDVRDPKLLLLRAAVASMVSYIFFNRGECSACALTSDLVVDKKHITLLLRKEKGLKNLQEGHMRTRQVPCDRAPRIAAMLAAFITRTGKMGQRRHRWALSPAEDKEQWSSYTLSGWLSAAFTAASQRPPEGFAWTSHSLRKGSASAANAIGVQLPDIRYTGGWSTNSNVLEEKYIDFSMQPTPAAWIFFGWLHKGGPSGDC